jgi:hypothetical protein
MTRTLAQIETLLDAHKLEAEMANGRWWSVRRNGKTKTWKTRPSEFSIPVKAGLRSYAYITQSNEQHFREKST